MVHEILQLVLETLGLLLIAAGLGYAMMLWLGWAGFLVTSGVVLLVAAAYGERQLHPPPPRPPSDNGVVDEPTLRMRFKNAVKL
jgi:hypothetical protein